MRFFSNDSRETSDDEARADERPERVTSDPVAVPVQRPASPSPWAATPARVADREGVRRPPPGGGATPPEGTDADRAAPPPGSGPDDPAGRVHRDADTDAPDSPTGERPPFHEPSPQPTAFGAATVGGAVAASAMANPVHDEQADTDRRTDAASGVADDRTVAAHDGAVADRADGSTPDDGRRPGSHPDARREDPTDLALEDGGTFSDPVVVEPGGDARGFAGSAPASTSPFEAPATARDDDAVPAAVAVPAGQASSPTGQASATGGSGPTPSAPTALPTPTAPANELPGGVSAPELGPLFADRDAHSFRDRWRDVQLHFVDDPKAATDEAGTLVDEVVDALAASLRSQRQQLTGTPTDEAGGDTERLRVRLRAYRDFLDRLLDL